MAMAWTVTKITQAIGKVSCHGAVIPFNSVLLRYLLLNAIISMFVIHIAVPFQFLVV